MKLSEVPGDRAIETIGRLAGPLAAIVTDEDVRKAVTEAGGSQADAAARAVPLLMQRHAGDVTECLAAVAGETLEEYTSSRNLTQVLGDLYELLTDEDAIAFLGSRQQTAGSASD